MEMEKSYPTIKALGGRIVDLLRFPTPDDNKWGAANPSIINLPRKGLFIAFRSSNYIIAPNGQYITNTPDNKFHSRIWIAELDKSFKLKNLREVDTSTVEGWAFDRGLEDPKLFTRDGEIYFSCVTMEKDVTPVARMAVAKLDIKKNLITEFTKLPGADDRRPEKNWMTPVYESSPNFDWIYGPNATITGTVLQTWMTDHPDLSALRGTTNLIPWGDGGHLAVMHRTFANQSRVWDARAFGTKEAYLRNYAHYFVEFDGYGIISSMSKGFQFHKAGVEFCSGITEYNKEFVMSFGREDVSAHLAVVPKSLIQNSLVPVRY
jgi:hypothetical protein